MKPTPFYLVQYHHHLFHLVALRLHCVVLLVIFSMLISHSHAAEIDSVTTRNVRLDDVLRHIDAIINERIQQGVDKANERRNDYEDLDSDKFCNEDILYDELRRSIFQSFTVSLGLKGYSLDKQLRQLLAKQSYALPLNDSIYRDINFLEGFSLNLKELSSVARVNGYLIGLDKIGHFFAEGWEYFERVNSDNEDLTEAISWGREQERGKFGYTTTGIFSYADLVANFNGYRFWNRVLKKEKDPVDSFINNLIKRPYVSCRLRIIDSVRYRKRVRSWQVNSRFTFEEYIDGTWDEGNNCNSYKDAAIEEKVSERIETILPGFKCPAQKTYCIKSINRYGSYAKDILHPSCLGVREY